MKKYLSILIGLIVIIGVLFYFFQGDKKDKESLDQMVLRNTYDISEEYLRLRYRTDDVLVNAEKYTSYDEWNTEMTAVIKGWEILESNATKLEDSAEKMSKETGVISFDLNFIPTVSAYDKEEISKIIDSAPMGKKIMTLAKHLGVDAKHAQLILNQDQAMISRETWGEEADTMQTYENDAMRIKNGCKVVGFVGTTVLSGGTSILATTATVVVGADLTLEIADDESRIALGDKNKVSEIVGELRTVTEPTAGILTIVTMPGNLTKSIDKLSAATFGADQLRSVIQDEKIIGISIKVEESGDTKIIGSALAKEELDQWLKDNKVAESTEPLEKMLKIEKTRNEEKENSAKSEDQQQANTDKTGNNEQESSETNKNVMASSEYNELDDDMKLRNIANVTKYLGEPDVITNDASGKTVYIYYDKIKYESGSLGSIKMTFYTEEQYKKYIENMGVSWDSNKENWDESGGGIRSTSEKGTREKYEKLYGN